MDESEFPAIRNEDDYNQLKKEVIMAKKKKKKSYVKFLKRKRKKRNTKGILKILKEKKTESEQSQDKVEPITSPMSDWSWKSEEENSN